MKPFASHNNPGVAESELVSKKEMEEWRKKGPLGKLHKFVVEIRQTPQRRNRFTTLSHGKMLIQDNLTRWGSWKAQIERAMVPQVKEAMHRYVAKYEEFQEDLPTTDD